MMFEVGREYRIVTGTGEHVGSSNYTVTEVELPLIKVEGAGFVTVMNTNSPEFVSAQLDDEEARTAVKAEHERFMDSLQGRAEAQRKEDDNAKLQAHYRSRPAY